MIEIQLSTSDLIQEVEREIQVYICSQGGPVASSHAYELFRRAIVASDEHAWIGICTLYAGLVSSWIIHLTKAEFPQEDVLSLVNEAFAKFARSCSAHKFADFPNLSHLLAYLKRCTQSAYFDVQRVRPCQRPTDVSYEEMVETIDTASTLHDPASTVEALLSAQEIWTIIARAVTSQDERLVLHQCCVGGMQPRELHHRYPALFPTVDDVYRVKRNVLERLRRNRLLQAYIEGTFAS